MYSMQFKTTAMIAAGALAVIGGWAISAQNNQDKYSVKVPGGIGFSDFKGYEEWQPVGPSLTDASNVIRLMVANRVMLDAYKKGVPGNGEPFPEGSKIAKIEWKQKKVTDPPFSASTPDTVPGDLIGVEFIEKDGKRFADTHGWGYGMFYYEAASGTFRPATTADKPPQDHNAKCGAACHELAAKKDFIFTDYGRR
jgi:Cytochrome P460